MTIGPAPMIRIDLMSVRLGIGPQGLRRETRHTKKGRAWCASFAPAGRSPRAPGLDQNRTSANPGNLGSGWLTSGDLQGLGIATENAPRSLCTTISGRPNVSRHGL